MLSRGSRTNDFRYQHDNNISKQSYYIAVSTMIREICKFLVKKGLTHKVLIDLGTLTHQSGVMIERAADDT